MWVPSEWQRETFAASGVEASKIRVVPEGVVRGKLAEHVCLSCLPVLLLPAAFASDRHPSLANSDPCTHTQNTTLFDPTRYAPLPDLAARAQLVFGSHWSDKAGPSASATAPAARSLRRDFPSDEADEVFNDAFAIDSAAGQATDGWVPHPPAGTDVSRPAEATTNRQPFRFISSFKWEVRCVVRAPA